MTTPVADTKPWPAGALATLGDELATPVAEFLRKIRDIDITDKDGNRLKDVDTEVKFTSGTPASLQVISAGATSISKWWTGAVASIGGLGVIGTALGAFYNKVGGNGPLLISLAVIIASAFGSVAVIVKADVTARAIATKSRRDSRASMVEGFLNNYQYAKADPCVVASAPTYARNYLVQKQGNTDWLLATGFTWDAGHLSVVTAKDLVAATEVSAIIDLQEVVQKTQAIG